MCAQCAIAHQDIALLGFCKQFRYICQCHVRFFEQSYGFNILRAIQLITELRLRRIWHIAIIKEVEYLLHKSEGTDAITVALAKRNARVRCILLLDCGNTVR